MVSWGDILLYAAGGLGIYAVILGILGIRNEDLIRCRRARRASLASVLATAGAALTLFWAFLSDDFRFVYVARNSARRLPFAYKISAFWAGQAGSLLLWLLLLSLLLLVFLLGKRDQKEALDVKVGVLVNILRILFLALLIFVSSPFLQTGAVPRDGQGLNPMLQSLGMLVHPPLLFLGFSGFAIPFGFLLWDLREGKKEGAWLARSRPWVLFSWLMLTLGIVTGGQWAYTELGWGGYWAWDPVENASLFPWLTATALLHCLQLPPEKRSTKLWCSSLTALTFLLTIFSTFLTRSGVLDSVHAFAGGLVGSFFLIILALLCALTLYWGWRRRDLLWAEEAVSPNAPFCFSQQSGILLGAVLLLLIFGGVFLGTMFPLLSRGLGGREIALSAGFYQRLAVPLFLALFLVLGLGPLTQWDKFDQIQFWRRIRLPALVGLSVFLGTFAFGCGRPWGSLSFGIAAFGFCTHLGQLFRKSNRSRLGASLVHLGVLLMLVGVTGSSVCVQESFQSVDPGQSIAFGGYLLKYSGLKTEWGLDKYSVGATLQVFKNEKHLADLTSKKIFYENREQPATEVGIFGTWGQDLYFNLAGWQGQTAQLQLKTFGLLVWIWLGAAVVGLGGVLLMLSGKGLGRRLARRAEHA